MAEEAFEVAVDGVVLRGHRGGDGPHAMLLHGGPGLPDYTAPLASELAPVLTTVRYTQRGTAPSDEGGPYSVERHAADALAVLDAFELDRAWAIGHSWGAQLALHLAVAHPDRLLGVVSIDGVGADGAVLEEYVANFRARMPADVWAQVDELEQLSEDRSKSFAEREQAALEQHHLLWPFYFADATRAGPDPLEHIGVECHDGTFASVKEHFERGTLADGLPALRLPLLFVHGADDPLPLRASTKTAALVPGATVETVPNAGHFPWLEHPGAVARAVGRFLAQS